MKEEQKIVRALIDFHELTVGISNPSDVTNDHVIAINNILAYLRSTNYRPVLEVALRLGMDSKHVEFLENIIEGKNLEKYGLIEGIHYAKFNRYEEN